MNRFTEIDLGHHVISVAFDRSNWGVECFAGKDVSGEMLRYITVGPLSLSVYTLTEQPLTRAVVSAEQEPAASTDVRRRLQYRRKAGRARQRFATGAWRASRRYQSGMPWWSADRGRTARIVMRHVKSEPQCAAWAIPAPRLVRRDLAIATSPVMPE